VWSVFAKRKRLSNWRAAFIVAAAFAAAGAIWVLATDVLLYQFTRDLVLIARVETAKGWVFVLLATALVYLVTLRCTSELSRAHAGVNAIIGSIADGVLLLGPDRRVWRANAAAERMLGTALVGMDAAEFSRRFRVCYPNGARVPPDQFISQRVVDEGGPLHYKAVLHPPHAPELIASCTAAAVRVFADEEPGMVVSVMHDITESEQLSRLRDQFFATAAHALKTPVAVIKCNAELLASGNAEQAARSAAAIDLQCDRIDLLVQNLLVLARIRSQTLRLHQEETTLAPLLQRVVAAAGNGTGQDVRCELEATPRVYADQERMMLLMRNLLDETLQTSVPGKPILVTLGLEGSWAVVGFRHCSTLVAERPTGYDELGINELVVATILSAHGGELARDADGPDAATWVRLPAIEAQ
jgi:signal transduction histidine kinase